jgi:hypothetical protein
MRPIVEITNIKQIKALLAIVMAEQDLRFGKTFRQAEEGTDLNKIYEALDPVSVNIYANQIVLDKA